MLMLSGGLDVSMDSSVGVRELTYDVEARHICKKLAVSNLARCLWRHISSRLAIVRAHWPVSIALHYIRLPLCDI